MKTCVSPALALVRLSPLALALSAVFAPSLAGAQSAAPSLGETVVTATRVEQPVSDLLADVSIIDRDTIERSGATGVADLLAQLPGVQFSRNGGIGNTTGVYIRGAETRFTAVYIDGVRIDSQSTGGAAWEAIPLSQIERIEVLRGPAAAVYGSDAIGGVVQFFTRKGDGKASPYIGLGGGSYGLRRAEAGISGAVGAFDYAFGVAYEESKGFNVRPVSGANPDRDGYRNKSVSARLGYRIDERHRLDATYLESDMNSGYDDFSYNPRRPVNDRSLYRLRATGLGWTAQWTDAYRTRLSITDSIARYDTQPSLYRTDTSLRGYLFQNEYRIGAHLLTAALERREDRLYNPTFDSFSSTLDRNRSQDALALGYGFHSGAHTLQLNARHDRDSEFGGKNTGSAAYGFAITPHWRVTASAGTAFRAPTLYQRFSQYGVAGLQPESSRNIEAGLKYTDGPTNAGIVFYRNRVNNLITFDNSARNCDSFFGCYANTARAQYRGATLSASHRLGDVTLRGSIDVQDPRDLGTDKLLVSRSRRHASAGADWRIGSWTLGAEVLAYSQRYSNAANTLLLPGYAVFNLDASTPIGQDFSLVARVDNVADKQYQLARGYATAGRTVYVGVKWQPK